MLCSLIELVGTAAIALGPHACADPGVIDINLSAYTVEYAGQTYDVGVGTSDWATPTGEYAITAEYDTSAFPAYAPVGLVTSARGKDAGSFAGVIAIHGSPSPGPGAVSHGCIRMRPADILALADKVGPGTAVNIHH